jgi:DNA-binding transcriptional MerR regulator
MKPEQLAKRLNVTSATLRSWAAKDFTEFLSPSAQGQNGSRRSFDDQDARILGWVAQMREQNIPLADIVAALRSAHANDWRGLPELPTSPNDEVALVPREAVEERVRGLQEKHNLEVQALTRARDELQARLGELEVRLSKSERGNDSLHQQLAEAHQQIVELSKELTSLAKKNRRA